MLTPEVEAAVAEIAANFPDCALSTEPDGQGGAFVILDSVLLGPPYAQEKTWVGFHITQACPYADVYPHFVRGDLSRTDGKALGEGLGGGLRFPPTDVLAMPARPAVQISRRSNHRSASDLETPLLKLLKVLRWLMSR
jgi:hypothetical protein